MDAARALDYIRNFAAAWSRAKPTTRAGMIQAVYQTVTVCGDQLVNVRLTDEAYAHGFAAALPQEVSVRRWRVGDGRENCGLWRARQVSGARMPQLSEYRSNEPVEL